MMLDRLAGGTGHCPARLHSGRGPRLGCGVEGSRLHIAQRVGPSADLLFRLERSRFLP